MSLLDRAKRLFIDKKVEDALDRMPKPVGSLGYDAWGFHSDTAKLSMSSVKPWYDHYFRVRTHGLKNIPKSGRALIIANHSGIIPIDAALLSYAIATSDSSPRITRAMIERFFPTVPFLGNLLNQAGAVVGDPVNCIKMLEEEEAILVFPEGVRGTGKTFNNRYQLQRFGHGFLHLAAETGTPIIPVGIIGCEEILPNAGNIPLLAKAMGTPYSPIAFPFPLPSKVVINIGKPMTFKPATSEDVVEKDVEKVKTEILRLMQKGLKERKGIFS